MLMRRLTGLSVLLCGLLLAGVARAQCSKDTDCVGDRVCENGACVAPPTPVTAVTAPPAPTAATPPASAAGSAATPPASSSAAPRAPKSPAAAAPTHEAARTKVHSPGMLVAGILMLGFAPTAAFIALSGNANKADCSMSGSHDCSKYNADMYGGLIGALVLTGVGGSLVAIGAKKEPVKSDEVRISAWATPHAVGIGLSVDL